MRFRILTITGAAALLLTACQQSPPRQQTEAQREREEKADAAARKAGKTAYQVTEKTKEAAQTLERELKRAGEQARAGWNEAKREDREKQK